jgi:hypothetical protein
MARVTLGLPFLLRIMEGTLAARVDALLICVESHAPCTRVGEPT